MGDNLSERDKDTHSGTVKVIIFTLAQALVRELTVEEESWYL